MRVLIFGGNGMLGHKLYQRLQTQFDVFATIRSEFGSIERFGIFNKPSIIANVDVTDPKAIERSIVAVKPDCVINAIGIIKQVPAYKDIIQTLSVNSIFPHRLAELSAEHGFRLITISTDCVFDGKKGNYSEDETPNSRDLYGLSKLLGEVTYENSLTIRTSVIGRELSTSHGIVEWFLGHRHDSVRGYRKAVYSGFPSVELADIISRLVAEQPNLTGLYHISSEPISKYHLLEMLNRHYQANISIERCEDVAVDRSLDSSRFRATTGFEPLKWDEMIRRMVADPTPYDSWRTLDRAVAN